MGRSDAATRQRRNQRSAAGLRPPPFGTEEDLIGFVTAFKERAEILG